MSRFTIGVHSHSYTLGPEGERVHVPDGALASAELKSGTVDYNGGSSPDCLEDIRCMSSVPMYGRSISYSWSGSRPRNLSTTVKAGFRITTNI